MKDNVSYHVGTNHRDMTITVGGGYGEGFTLDPGEHKDLVEAAVEGASGEIHVMAGVVGGYGVQKLMARNAENAGAGSIIIFFPRQQTPTADIAYSYLRGLAESVNVGVIVFPFGTHGFWTEVLEKLAGVTNIVGFLAPNVSPEYTLEFGKTVNKVVPGRYLWIAENENHAMPSFVHGCAAYTAAAPAIVPDSSWKFWSQGVAGDIESMGRVFEEMVSPINKIRSFKPGYGISGIKVALEILGRHGGPPRPPEFMVEKYDREIIRDILLAHAETRHMVGER
jgi:5-dehydro-4-deoxyglucarate dehydratase